MNSDVQRSWKGSMDSCPHPASPRSAADTPRGICQARGVAICILVLTKFQILFRFYQFFHYCPFPFLIPPRIPVALSCRRYFVFSGSMTLSQSSLFSTLRLSKSASQVFHGLSLDLRLLMLFSGVDWG